MAVLQGDSELGAAQLDVLDVRLLLGLVQHLEGVGETKGGGWAGKGIRRVEEGSGWVRAGAGRGGTGRDWVGRGGWGPMGGDG